MGITLVRGRPFGVDDRAGASPVAIVNATLARRLWGADDPVGQRLRFGPPEEPWVTVVGVSADVRHEDLEQEPRAAAYRPFAQAGRGFAFLALRAAGDPASPRRVGAPRGRRPRPRPRRARRRHHAPAPARRGGAAPLQHPPPRLPSPVPPFSWPRSASTEHWPTPSPSARANSASASPSARAPPRSALSFWARGSAPLGAASSWEVRRRSSRAAPCAALSSA